MKKCNVNTVRIMNLIFSWHYYDGDRDTAREVCITDPASIKNTGKPRTCLVRQSKGLKKR